MCVCVCVRACVHMCVCVCVLNDWGINQVSLVTVVHDYIKSYFCYIKNLDVWNMTFGLESAALKNPGVLRNVEYPIIGITPMVTLTQSGSTC